MGERSLVVGTRGSPLALWQAERVVEALRRAHPGLAVRVRSIRTEGDRRPEASFREFTGRGVFVRELEAALAEGRVDIAVHSAKDVPTELAPGLELGSALERHDPRDALVGRRLWELPHGARVGTSSPRRRAALAALRPDLVFHDLRGNIETRLRKLDEGRFDAVVLACAGLDRLGLGERIAERLAPEVCLPAPGQGIIAIETRADDRETMDLLVPATDAVLLSCLRAERSVLASLGGGCQIPIGALATVTGGLLRLVAAVASPDGRRLVRQERTGAASAPEALGREVAEQLLEAGAADLLKEDGS